MNYSIVYLCIHILVLKVKSIDLIKTIIHFKVNYLH